MKLIYNGFDWSTVGEISVSQSREFEGGEQPQRAKVKLAVGVDIFQATYDQNRAAIDSAASSLTLPNGVLEWINDAAGVTYVNQTAVLVSEDLPEDWGQYHQRVNLVFQYYEQSPAGAANNLPLQFIKGPEPGQAFHFSIVNRWQHSAGVERFSALRSQRQLMKGKVHVEGQIFGDTTLDLATRRAGLAAQAATLVESLNCSEGQLAFGAGGSVFNQAVRIEEFTADLDQLVNAINFAFTASYTLFPDEGDYATAEWTAAERDEFTGTTILTVAGKIQAQDEAAARAKLALLLAQVVSDYGYTAGQPLSIETTPNGISANADGDTFTELTFSAQYRGWAATNQVATVVGSGALVPLGNVNKWADQVDTTRFSPLRDQRERTEGKVVASGTWVLPGQGNALNGTSGTNGTNILSNRTQLLVMQRAMKTAVNGPSVTLAYGDWSQAVRVVNFSAEINQAETGIDWSMTVVYTLFPNEASYAMAEYTCAEHDDFTGELRLGISGRIQAQTEAAARAKLAAVLTAQLTSRNYLKLGVIVSFEATPNAIEADADGATFTELAFTVQYKKWKSSNQAAAFNPGAGPVALGNVGKWHDRVSVTRFNPLRPHRERAGGTIEAAGCWRADQSLTVTQRRAALLAQQRAMKAAINVAQGTLTYADWSQVVRVSEFNAEINQAETGIEWSLVCGYTLFPSEADYTTTEWTAQEKDPFTGELTLLLAGKIQATTYALAFTQMNAVVTAATTQWGYAATGQQLALEHTSANLMANGDGATFTELSFSATWRKWKSTNQLATFMATGKTNPRALGQVTMWRVHYAAQRFNELRSQRRHATGAVVASGTLAGNMALSLADRRTALLAAVATLQAEVNGADGTLVYGSAFTQVVRVEDFQAEVNQAETGIEWSMTASYSLFPNEGGYATAEYTLQTRSDVESGDEFLSFAGKIGAPTGTLALAKLTVLRTATLAAYGWNVNQQVRADNSFAHVYANGDATATLAGDEGSDGTTFLELSFSEEYRRRLLGSLISSTLTIANREEITSQTLLTTYSGTVTATGASVDAAYATALQRAQALGANREAAIDPTAFLKGSTLTQEQRWTTVANGVEFVRLAFSYEYQSKLSAGRAYLEMTTAVQQDVFGVDGETCSGFIAARDQATAAALYLAQIVPLYAGRLIQTQQTSFSQSQNQTSDDRTDQIRTTGQGTYELTSGSGPGAAFNAQHLRMEFSLTVYSPKAAGVTGLKYSIEVTRDFLTLELRMALQGSCWAGNRAMADTAVSALLAALGLPGQGKGPTGMASVRSRRVEDRESNTLGSQGDGVADVLLKLDFEEEFTGRVTGVAGVIEMELTEEVLYSGTRWSVQPLPFNPDGSGGVSIPQPSGLEHGSRTVTGSVTAGTFATAQAWGKAQRTLLTGDALGGKYPQPEKWTTGYQFVPQIDGIPKGMGANVKLFKVGFTFAEVLPLYPAP